MHRTRADGPRYRCCLRTAARRNAAPRARGLVISRTSERAIAPPRIPALVEPAHLDGSDLIDEASFAGVAVTSARLAGADVPGLTFSESSLTKIDLTDARLLRLGLSDVILTECNFSNCRTKSPAMRRVAFVNCKLTGLAFDAGSFSDVVLSDSRIDFARFDGTKLKNVAFERCQMRDIDFLNVSFENVTFADCDLTRATFDRMRIADSQMRRCRLTELRGLTHLRGIAMEWNDVTEHAELFATELGIRIV